MPYKKTNIKGLEFEKFFSGKVQAIGYLELYFPKMALRNLIVDFEGEFKKNNLILKEKYYENEKRIIRNWKFKKISKHQFLGEEKNVIGKIKVKIDDKRIYMKYKFRLKVWKINLAVTISDYMYYVNNKEIINTTYVKKFGLKLAKAILLYKKLS
ncbi:MAG: DUF3833 family protein [Pseudomonadota bacterium]|nr:DUF3833 family protein [Pseudomonadota bacterium]